MKPAGYWECRNAIISARLNQPHKYEPFTELFDVGRLEEIRAHYGEALYRECYSDVMKEANEP